MTDHVATPARARLAANARRVSPFQWKLLTLFLIIGSIGAGLYAYAAVVQPVTPAVSTPESGPPGGASGFLSAEPAAAPAAAPGTDSWTGWAGAKGTALGFGFVGGFVIGFVFRAFLKFMAGVTFVVVGGLALLSYFNVLNIDLTAARTAYESNAHWLTDQATRLKDVVLNYLPSSTTGAAGVFFGLRRR
jgi:uncharacterized membrane protein (Fun14 family)